MVTIKDVARLAGVSIATVSMVVNNKNNVKMETRYRVQKAIDELHYFPNQTARALITSNKRVVGVIHTVKPDKNFRYTFDDPLNTYQSDMIEAIVHETNHFNYSIMIDSISIPELHEEKLPDVMDPNRVDGVLMLGGYLDDALVELYNKLLIPVVIVGARHKDFDYIDADVEKALYMGTKYLIQKGHKDIAFINSPVESQSLPRKLAGYQKALAEAGISFRKDIYSEGSTSPAAGYSAIKQIWTNGNRPTALVGLDASVLGALRYLQEQGLRCPEDISIMGFEDGVLAEMSIPPLTTVRIQKGQIGQEACRVLLNRLTNANAKPVHLIIDPEIVERSSVMDIT